jgi:transposase
MYVDDLLVMGNNGDHISQVKKECQLDFEMTDLGLLHYNLRVEVIQEERNIFISQAKYVSKLLKKFGMEDCKPTSTPKEQNLKLSKFKVG